MKTKKWIVLIAALMFGVYAGAQDYGDNSVLHKPYSEEDILKIIWLANDEGYPIDLLLPPSIVDQMEIVKKYFHYNNNSYNPAELSKKYPICKECPLRSTDPSSAPPHLKRLLMSNQDIKDKLSTQ